MELQHIIDEKEEEIVQWTLWSQQCEQGCDGQEEWPDEEWNDDDEWPEEEWKEEEQK